MGIKIFLKHKTFIMACIAYTALIHHLHHITHIVPQYKVNKHSNKQTSSTKQNKNYTNYNKKRILHQRAKRKAEAWSRMAITACYSWYMGKSSEPERRAFPAIHNMFLKFSAGMDKDYKKILWINSGFLEHLFGKQQNKKCLKWSVKKFGFKFIRISKPPIMIANL